METSQGIQQEQRAARTGLTTDNHAVHQVDPAAFALKHGRLYDVKSDPYQGLDQRASAEVVALTNSLPPSKQD